MHRKFIALIVASAIAVTGLSASQARAADTRDIIGGLAAIAIIGAAIHHYEKDKSKKKASRKKSYVHKQPKHVYKKPTVKKHHVRRKPQRVARYDLPHRCLRTYKGYGPNRKLLGPSCLTKHYKYSNSLPHQCKVGFWNGNKVSRAYEPACLRQQGYRVVYQ